MAQDGPAITYPTSGAILTNPHPTISCEAKEGAVAYKFILTDSDSTEIWTPAMSSLTRARTVLPNILQPGQTYTVVAGAYVSNSWKLGVGCSFSMAPTSGTVEETVYATTTVTGLGGKRYTKRTKATIRRALPTKAYTRDTE